MRAVVDIGSNSIKFLVGEIQRGAPVVVDKGSWITRLGRGLKKGGALSPLSVQDSITALEKIGQRLAPLTALSSENLHIVATSAVRDTAQPELIAEPVKRIFARPLRVLSGLEEAEWSFQGAEAALRFTPPTCAFPAPLFIDVGGASTEVGRLHPQFSAHSFQAGAVRCHEALGLDEIPVSDATWHAAQARIADFFPPSELSSFQKSPSTPPSTVAVGGSLLISARLAQAQEVTDTQGQFLGFRVSREQLKDFNNAFRKLSMEERLQHEGLEPGRADVLCAGLLCLTHLMERMESQEVFVTEWGLRHGILFSGKIFS